MKRCFRPRFCRWATPWATMCGVALLGLTLSASAVRAQNAEQAVGNHLQAGEFGPAMAVARQQQGEVRDRLMGQIAQAQAGAGMRQAAFDTVGGITNSRAFGQSLQGISNQGIGDGFGGRGGGAGRPDFESLIELITSTVKP